MQPAELYVSRVSLYLILILCLPGCTRSEYPNETYAVSGRIQTAAGEPASYVRVTLHSSKLVSEGDPFRPSAMTDDDARPFAELSHLRAQLKNNGSKVPSYHGKK